MAYENINIQNNSLAPKAFPGKYPTRVDVYAKVEGKGFHYVGKPVRALFDAVGALLRSGQVRVSEIVFTEFDQNGRTRQTNGGLMSGCPFADLYYPMPGMLREQLGRLGKLFMSLNREVRTVAGRQVYCFPLFRASAWEAEATRMMNDCARAKLTGRWFTRERAGAVCDWLAPTIRLWGEVPRKAEKTQVMPAMEAGVPQQMPWFMLPTVWRVDGGVPTPDAMVPPQQPVWLAPPPRAALAPNPLNLNVPTEVATQFVNTFTNRIR
jgi:hypothetical protein